MKKCWVIGLIAVLLVISGLPGCFNHSDSGTAPVLVQDKEIPTANVTFVINAQAPVSSLRAATAPTVVFQLELLNPTSSTNPVLVFKKTATVAVDGTNYSAQVEFVNVPALPCLAKMSISGGHIVAADTKSYANWVGLKDLVANTANTITLIGEGSKTRDDVAYNLLQQLIADPKNVPSLPTPTFTKIYEIVDSLNLSSTSVYTDAKSAYDQLYAPAAPADAEFALPTGYTSVAYPKSDATTNLAIANFASTSEVYLVLANRSAGSLTPSWSASRATANLRAGVVANQNTSSSGLPVSPEHRFHLMLRQMQHQLPSPSIGGQSEVRPSLRAVAVNDQVSFTAYLDHDSDPSTGAVVQSFTATCKSAADISGTTKKVYFFLDNNDLARTGVDTVVAGIVSAWSSIYSTNRNTFGAEPENTFNGLDVNDFYILMSSKIYTAGYFYSGDLYPKTTVASSNEKKIFYLQYPVDSTDLPRSITDLSATMAHEFQHMIHFFQNKNQVAWIDEAMSGYAEQVNGYKIENGQNQSKALQVQKYLEKVGQISLQQWHGENELDGNIVHAHYGKAYLIGTWLAQNYGSSGSVQNLISSQLTDVAAVEAFTGETFSKTAGKFLMAMLVNESAGGVYGIKGLDLTNTYSFGTGWADVTLTGPAMTTVNFTGATSGAPTLLPYTAAYVKITNGTGSTLNVTATLPTGVSLFQLKKN